MKVATRNHLEQVMEKHTGRKMRITRDAASLMYLRYVIFMKQIANKADAVAFSQKKPQIGSDILARSAPRLLTEFSDAQNIRLKALKTQVKRRSNESVMKKVEKKREEPRERDSSEESSEEYNESDQSE